MKKLYHFSLSPFCRKIRLVLGEKKIDVELIEEKFWEKRVQFIKINHAGEVPVYKENHLTLSDSNAIFEYLEEKIDINEDLTPLASTAIKKLEKLSSINKKISSDVIDNIKQLKDPSKIADNVASHLNATISEKQQLFETLDVKKRLNSIIK